MSFGIVCTRFINIPTFTELALQDQKESSSLVTLTQQASLKFFCVEGCGDEMRKQIKDISIQNVDITSNEYEEVAENQIGEKVGNFLAKWDTQGFSNLEVQQEKKLLENFFLQNRNTREGINHLKFFRKDPNTQYSISIIGPEIQKVCDSFKEFFTHKKEQLVLEKSLEMQKQELKNNNLLVKEKVAVTFINNLALLQGNKLEASRTVLFDTTKNFTHFNESYRKTLQNYITTTESIFAESIFAYALCPTIVKMQKYMNQDGVVIISIFENFSILESMYTKL